MSARRGQAESIIRRPRGLFYYRGRRFDSLKGYGFKANYRDLKTGEYYWISGCKKDGTDALYSTTIQIDDDVREEYWTEIRKKPELKNTKSYKRPGKYSR